MRDVMSMGPFVRGYVDDEQREAYAQRLAAITKSPLAEVRAHIEREHRDEQIWMNEKYQVAITPVAEQKNFPACLHLSIKRRDRGVIREWRDLQTIKSVLVGAENEGFEVFPAESRVTDTANQYHLWVFVDPTIRLPVGWATRATLTPEQASMLGAKQRAFEDGTA